MEVHTSARSSDPQEMDLSASVLIIQLIDSHDPKVLWHGDWMK